MKRYSVAEARAKLTSLLDAVSAGEEVEITRRGKPLARVLRSEGGLGAALSAWRKEADPGALVGSDWADGLPDRADLGRKVDL